MRRKSAVVAASVVLSGLLAGSAWAQVSSNVVREGEGPRRAELNGLELKPFFTDIWSTLSDFQNGAPITQGATTGKVVLFVTWADWYAPSSRALSQAKRLAEKYAKDGLVVVAVHGAEGWAEAKKPAAAEGATFILALDKNGEFRRKLKIDQDPDFYLVDRAGQLRFADVATESVDQAVEMLVKESAEDAGGVNQKLAADAQQADIERRRSEAIRASLDLTALPEIPFEMPAADAFKDLKWPRKLRDPNAPPPDPTQPEELVQMAMSETGWFPEKPELEGRVVLMYFWHPGIVVSFYNHIPKMDLLQKQHPRDLVVVGVLTPLVDQNGQDLKLENDPEKIQKRLEEFKANRDLGHSLLMDLQGGLFNLTKPGTQIPIPWVAIRSSDGTMRWAGPWFHPACRAALDTVLRIDPGVNARRRAEDAYLKAKGGK